MASYRETIAERKKAFREIKRAFREVDTVVERAQRFLNRKLNLKRAPIEADDLDQVLAFIRLIAQLINGLIKLIERLKEIFG